MLSFSLLLWQDTCEQVGEYYGSVNRIFFWGLLTIELKSLLRILFDVLMIFY